MLAVSGKLLPLEGLYPAYWVAAEIATRALYTSIPLAFGLLLFSAARPFLRGELPGELALSLRFAALAGAVMASAWPRADFYHVISVYPVVLLLLFDRAGARRRGSVSSSGARWIGRGALISLLAVTGTVSGLHQSTHRHHLNLERADLHISPFSAWVESIVKLARTELEPGDPLFVYGHEAAFYFLAERFPTWRFAQLYPGQAGADRGRELADHLRAHPPAVIVRGLAGTPSLDTYTPELLSWVKENYEVDTKVFEAYPPPVDFVPPRWMVAVLRKSGEGE